MGYLLGLVLANLFMGFHEPSWLQIFKDWNNFVLSLRGWYYMFINICSWGTCFTIVPVLFCVIKIINSKFDTDKFYEVLNKQHPSIKLTFEEQ